MDILPDGVTDIAGGEIDTDSIMLLPGDMMTNSERRVNDERKITERKRNLLVASKTKVRVLDQMEKGDLNYVMMKVSQTLPDGSTGAAPEKLAVFLQLDGYAQGGFESVYDSALGQSVAGFTLSTLSSLNLPEQFGMWYLTVDQSQTKVLIFRGNERYNHRLRLDLFNTDTSSSINIEFVEISRTRSQTKDGKGKLSVQMLQTKVPIQKDNNRREQ